MTSETKNRMDLPWKAGTGSEAVIYDNTGCRRIHEPGDHDSHDFVDLNGPEDAAYIVKSVNNHEALVAMVRDLSLAISGDSFWCELLDLSNKLLASLEKPDV